MMIPRLGWLPWLLLLAAGCGPSTAQWLEQMKSGDPLTRLQAVHALQERTKEGKVVIPALVAALKDENTYVRRDAARALGRFGAEAREAAPALLAALRDKE